jgi:hypothetical protein
MSNRVQWSSPVSRVTGISAVSINAGDNSLGSVIDNNINKDRWASLELQFTFSIAPVAGKVFELYLLYATDDTNYEDGDAAPTDPVKVRAGVFGVRAVTTAQRVSLTNIPLAPFKFKCLLKSELAQNATSVTLNMYSYSEELV